MQRVTLDPGADLEGFRRAVRGLLAAGIQPADILWNGEDEGDLFARAELPDGPPVALPRAVAQLIETIVCHRDPERYALLYQLVFRVSRGEKALLDVASDPLVHRLHMMRKSVARDLHKMHAFLRFRRIERPEGEHFIAWFEPDHFILKATASFFVERFRALHWSILTPDGAMHWDGAALRFGPPGRRADAPEADGFEAGWQSYYESTFNPARLNTRAMMAEMPKKYWSNMPEAALIPRLVQSAQSRVRDMMEKEAAMPVKRDPVKSVAAMADQAPASLEALNRIIAAAEPLVPGATRAVLGEGPIGADIAFVGEQPGDQEDLAGRPFVGPAGQLLDRALAEVGIQRERAYLTNAVKHFKFEQKGKRRIHQKPTVGEVKHYRWWLMQELDFVRPKLVVALGATAVLALAGKAVPITKARGPATLGDWPGYITVHPSYLLRLPDAAAKADAYRAFVSDLARTRHMLESGGSIARSA